MLNKLLNRFKFIFYKYYFVREKIFFSRGAYAENSEFFGFNRVGSKSKVYNSKIGSCTYLGSNNCFDGVSIGKFCSIANDVKIDLGKHPTSQFVSTSPIFYSFLNPSIKSFNYIPGAIEEFEESPKTINGYNAEIGNDVWICNGVRIKQGVIIGDGAIVASGAVVTKNVEPYSIVAGVPAKLIRKRFNDKEIEFLLEFKWWNKSRSWLNNNRELFKNIDLLIKAK